MWHNVLNRQGQRNWSVDVMYQSLRKWLALFVPGSQQSTQSYTKRRLTIQNLCRSMLLGHDKRYCQFQRIQTIRRRWTHRSRGHCCMSLWASPGHCRCSKRSCCSRKSRGRCSTQPPHSRPSRISYMFGTRHKRGSHWSLRKPRNHSTIPPSSSIPIPLQVFLASSYIPRSPDPSHLHCQWGWVHHLY